MKSWTLALLLWPLPAWCGPIPLRLVSDQLMSDGSNIQFQTIFNRMPDFFTLDSFGRQADSFQFYIDYNLNDPTPFNSYLVDVLIRGEEIHVGGGIPIRNAQPFGTSGPDSGGWGPLVDSVAYSLSALGNGEAELRFAVPTNLMDGPFLYGVETYGYGSTTSSDIGTFPGAPKNFSKQINGPVALATPEPQNGVVVVMSLVGIYILRRCPHILQRLASSRWNASGRFVANSMRQGVGLAWGVSTWARHRFRHRTKVHRITPRRGSSSSACRPGAGAAGPRLRFQDGPPLG
jgi:hypothetical protein